MGHTNGQVLVFKLGDESYCVSIDYVTEIVDIGELTSVPNSPDHVVGVMDLRGTTTSIVDPKIVFGVETDDSAERIVVFDPKIIDDQAAAGWLVDEVDQVVQIGDELDEAPAADDDAIRGVIKREDGSYIIYVDPAAIHSA